MWSQYVKFIFISSSQVIQTLIVGFQRQRVDNLSFLKKKITSNSNYPEPPKDAFTIVWGNKISIGYDTFVPQYFLFIHSYNFKDQMQVQITWLEEVKYRQKSAPPEHAGPRVFSYLTYGVFIEIVYIKLDKCSSLIFVLTGSSLLKGFVQFRGRLSMHTQRNFIKLQCHKMSDSKYGQLCRHTNYNSFPPLLTQTMHT